MIAASLAPLAVAVLVRTSGGQPGPSQPVDPEVARQTADEILARPEYQPEQPSLLVRMLRWLAHHLRFRPPQRSAGVTPQSNGRMSPISTVVLLLVVAVVAYLVYRLVQTLVREGWPRRRRRAADDDEVEVEQDAPSAGASLAEADRLEAEGRWREAVQARYRSTVGRLSGAGWVTPRPGTSPGELRRDVEIAVPEVQPPFSGLTGDYEDVWYGGAEPDAARMEAVRAAAAAVVAGTEQLAAAGRRPARVAAAARNALDDADDAAGMDDIDEVRAGGRVEGGVADDGADRARPDGAGEGERPDGGVRR